MYDESFVLHPTSCLGRHVSGNQKSNFKERFHEMPIFTRPTSDDGPQPTKVPVCRSRKFELAISLVNRTTEKSVFQQVDLAGILT